MCINLLLLTQGKYRKAAVFMISFSLFKITHILLYCVSSNIPNIHTFISKTKTNSVLWRFARFYKNANSNHSQHIIRCLFNVCRPDRPESSLLAPRICAGIPALKCELVKRLVALFTGKIYFMNLCAVIFYYWRFLHFENSWLSYPRPGGMTIKISE